jgi:type I restriction enzyme S subunit
MNAMIGETLKLRDIITLKKGKPPAQQSYFETDAELYLTPEYLRGRASAELVKPSANAVRVSDGETILLWDGSNAGEFFRARRGILASTMSLISHDDTFDKEYLFYAVKSWESYLKGQTSGSGIPHVDKEIFGNIEIVQFPKPEQTKIAEILSTVDRAIEQTEALIAKQQRIKTGLMQDLLTRGIDEHGNLRSEQTHKFKDSPLGRIPAEWEIEQLGKNSDLITSGARGWAMYYSEDGAAFIRIGNLTREHINLRLDDLVFVQPPDSAEGHRTCVAANDILLSITADLGMIGVVPFGFGEGYVNQHIALVRPAHEAVCSRFVGWFLSSHKGQSQFAKLNESGAKSGLNLPTVCSLLFPKPAYAEQERIAEVMDESVRRLDHLKQNRIKLKAIKTALMQDLLTGKKRVTELLNDTKARKYDDSKRYGGSGR